MPDRYDIDSVLYNAIPRGALTRLAEHRGVSVETVSRDYVPHNTDYQSKFSRALMELAVISGVAPQWARNIVAVFNRFGAEWCGPVEVSAEVGTVLEKVAALAMRLQNPRTPQAEKLPLALELKGEVQKVVDGLMFDGIEDSPDVEETEVKTARVS